MLIQEREGFFDAGEVSEEEYFIFLGGFIFAGDAAVDADEEGDIGLLFEQFESFIQLCCVPSVEEFEVDDFAGFFIRDNNIQIAVCCTADHEVLGKERRTARFDADLLI